MAAADAVDPAGALTYAFDFDNDGTYEVGPQAGNSAAHTCSRTTGRTPSASG